MTSRRILALAGSYRRGSMNHALIEALKQVAPPDIEIAEFDLRTVPHYDGDLEAQGDPETVAALKAAISEADALVIATPEYNSGMPGVLKNAIDWASRYYPDAPIGGKVCAVIGATPGRSGTKYAQEQLRQVLGRTGAVVLDGPEIALARASDDIVDGAVVSDELRAALAELLDSVAETIHHCEATGSASVAG